MVVLVTGSRNHKDKDLIWSALDDLPISELIEGGARGADALARGYCREHGIKVCTHNAGWGRYGRRAGPIRNQTMLDLHPDILLVVAFPLPESKGTWDMVRRARQSGLYVEIVYS